MTFWNFEKKRFGGHLQKSHIVKIAKFWLADLPRGLEQLGKKGGGPVCPLFGNTNLSYSEFSEESKSGLFPTKGNTAPHLFHFKEPSLGGIFWNFN